MKKIGIAYVCIYIHLTARVAGTRVEIRLTSLRVCGGWR